MTTPLNRPATTEGLFLAVALSQGRLAVELGGLLPSEELAGLAVRMKAATVNIAEWLEGPPGPPPAGKP